MGVHKAYKFRLDPTQAQQTLLQEILQTCREVYNSFLHWRRYDYEIFKTSPSYYDQKKALPLWKKEHPELGEVHGQVLQNVCKRVELAYDSYFDRLADYQLRKEQGRLKILNDEPEKYPGPPRPKGRGSYDSLTYTQATGFSLGKDCIRFSKLATMSPAPKLDLETGHYLPNGHAAKAGLNKSILDAGWGSFRMILKSKAESAGRELYEINPAFTSQDCANCGYRPPKDERKKLSDRWHACPKCGYSVHRDKNSAVLQDKIGVGLHTVRHRPREAAPFMCAE